MQANGRPLGDVAAEEAEGDQRRAPVPAHRLARLVVVAACAAVFAANAAWIVAETRPPHWDMGRHLWNSLVYQAYAENGRIGDGLLAYLYYPPLVYWVAVPFYALLGTSVEAAVAGNVVWLTLLAAATFGLGRSLAGPGAGALAVLFVLGSPMMVTQLKEFQLDAPLTAMVAAALLALVRSRDLAARGPSLLFGLASGLGMLVKWTFCLFLVAPAAWALVRAVRLDRAEGGRARTVNAALAAAVALPLGGYWYARNLGFLRADAAHSAAVAAVQEGDPQVLSLASVLWYAGNVVGNQLHLLPALAALGGLGWALADGERRRRAAPLLWMAAGSYALLTCVPNKDARYTLPLVVGAGVLAAAWVASLRPLPRRVATAALSGWCAVSFVAISFGIPGLPARVELPGVRIGPHPVVVFAQRGYIIGPPSGEDWRLEAIFRDVAADPSPGKDLWYVGDDTLWFNGWAMAWYEAFYPVRVTSAHALVPAGDRERASFLAIRATTTPPAPDGFEPFRAYPLPDGGQVSVFRRR